MKKKTVLVISLILVMCITAGVFLLRDKLMDNDAYSFHYQKNIEVTNGKVEPESISANLTVKNDGIHTISLSWLPMGMDIEEAMKLDPSELCFVTGCVISSEKEPCVYATTGGWLTIDTDIELEAGEYKVDYYYLSDKEAYIDFATKYFGSINAERLAEDIDWDHMKKDDKFVISYNSSVSRTGGFAKARLILLAVTLLLVMLIALLVYYIATQGTMEKFRFDERQEALRGRGFRLSFYVLLGYILWIFMVDTMGFIQPEYHTILYVFGLIIGVLVYAVYAIWNDCYFAMNEKKSTSIWLIAIVGIANLMIGIVNMKIFSKVGKGAPFGIGVSKTPLINLAVAVMFIVIAVTMVLKKMSAGRSAADDEEGDE